MSKSWSNLFSAFLHENESFIMIFYESSHKTESGDFHGSRDQEIQTTDRAVHVRGVFTETRKFLSWILEQIDMFKKK